MGSCTDWSCHNGSCRRNSRRAGERSCAEQGHFVIPDEARGPIIVASQDIQKFLDSVIVYENHPYYVNFVPFGVPQFQGKRPLKGSLLALGQGVMFGTTVSSWLYLSTKYGFPTGNAPER